jgi:hypothetical protein
MGKYKPRQLDKTTLLHHGGTSTKTDNITRSGNSLSSDVAAADLLSNGKFHHLLIVDLAGEKRFLRNALIPFNGERGSFGSTLARSYDRYLIFAR